jgi:hypothetical protein
LCEDLAAYPVEDQVGAVTAGQAARLHREVRGPVVDAMIQAEPCQAGQLVVAGRGGQDTRPGPRRVAAVVLRGLTRRKGIPYD